MIWLAAGGIWAVCAVLAVVLLLRAERTCVCRCQHARCRQDITDDDMLCDHCRMTRGLGVPHCHLHAQAIDGRSRNVIIMPDPE